MWAVCMDCEGWKEAERRPISGLEWSERASWRRGPVDQSQKDKWELLEKDGIKEVFQASLVAWW